MEEAKKEETKGEEGETPMDDDMESITCYCGKDRDVGSLEFQCGFCLRFYHSDCVSCYFGKCIPFMTNYQFFCKRCNPNGLESFNKKQATFSQICLTTLANLMNQNQGKTLFSKDKDIIPYIDKNWESMTTMPRRIKLTWHNTISKTMLKEVDVFVHNDENAADPKFGLLNQDLSKVAPNYESLFKAAGPMFKPSDYRMGTGIGDSKTRGTKRKAFDNQLMPGVKQKKQDPSTSTKIAPHGYPMEHPYNKDGYRYLLAEPDPHAPNRREFDESIEWAGKPIPPYLYRTWLSSQVLLALHDRAPQLKISDDRLTVTGEKGYSMVRATHGVNRGTWYYEVKVNDLPEDAATRMGWSQQLGNLQAPCGYDKFSYSWRSRKGTRFHASKGRHYSKGYGSGAVLGFLIHLPSYTEDVGKLLPETSKDKPLVKFKSNLYFEEKDYVTETEKALTELEGSKIVMYRNGKNQGEAWTELYQGTYYPAISIFKGATVTVNFGPNFRFPPKDTPEARPLCEVAQDHMVEHTLQDMLYHIDHEGKLPEF